MFRGERSPTRTNTSTDQHPSPGVKIEMYPAPGTPGSPGSPSPVGMAQVTKAPDGYPSPGANYGQAPMSPDEYKAQSFQLAQAYKKQIKDHAKKAKEVNEERKKVPAETVGFTGPQGTWGLELLDGEVEIFSTIVSKEELVAGDYKFCGDGLYCCLTQPKRQMVSSICDRFVVMVTNRRVVVREEDFRKREGWDKSSHMTHWFRFLVYYPTLLFLCYGRNTVGKGVGTKKVIKERQYMAVDLKDVQYSFEETEVDLDVHRRGGVICNCAGLVDDGEVELPPSCVHHFFYPCIAQKKKFQEKELRVELHLQFVKRTADYQGAHWKWFEGVGASVATEVIKGKVLSKEDGHALRRALMMHPTRLQQADAMGTIASGPAGGMGGAGGMGMGATNVSIVASGAQEHKVAVPVIVPSARKVMRNIWSSVKPVAKVLRRVWGQKVMGNRKAKLNKHFYDGDVTGNEVRIKDGEAKIWSDLEVNRPAPATSSPVATA